MMTFRTRLTMHLVMLSVGCVLVLSVAVLLTAGETIRSHFEEMAIESTSVSAELVRIALERGELHDATSLGDLPPTTGTWQAAFRSLDPSLIGARSVLVDEHGELVLRVLPSGEVISPPVSQAISKGAVALFGVPGFDNTTVPARGGLWVGIPIHATGIRPDIAVFRFHSMHGAERLVRLTAAYVGGLSILLALAAVLIGSRISARISNPLRKLHRAATEIGKGQLEHRICIDSNDEFGEVAHAVNTMAASLHSYMAEVEAEAQRREKLESEMRIASQLQQALLPKTLPTFRGIELATKSRPAQEVGGDFYDVLAAGDDALYLAIGDATNKGLPAALHITQCASTIRTLAREGYSPAQVLRQANALLYEYLGDTCRFVTMFLARLDLRTHELVYSGAGHNPPILFRSSDSETIFVTDEVGLPLGLSNDATFADQQVQLYSGDVLALYTDGLTEAMNVEGELLGTSRIMQTLQDASGLSANGILESLLHLAEGHEQGVRMDDLTLLLMRMR